MRGLLENVFSTGRNLLENRNFRVNSVRGEHAKPTSYSANHKVDKLEKRFLVWTGKYKTLEDVPALVPQNVMERARNRMRIRIANCMIGLTAIGCIAMIYLGKKAAARGESVSEHNLEWHRQYNEDARKKDAQ